MRSKSPFEQSRHGDKPVWIKDGDMVGPLEGFLHGHEVGFERLDLFVAFVENRIEFQIAEIDAAHLEARITRTFLIGIGERTAFRLFVRMSEKDEDFFGGHGDFFN